jgi:hypothetical protein
MLKGSYPGWVVGIQEGNKKLARDGTVPGMDLRVTRQYHRRMMAAEEREFPLAKSLLWACRLQTRGDPVPRDV